MKLSTDFKKLLLIFLSTSLFLSSCKDKEYTTTIEGRVINFMTNEPVDSVYVRLKDGIASGGGWVDFGGGNTSSGITSLAITDKDGYFKVSITGTHHAALFVTKDRDNGVTSYRKHTSWPKFYGGGHYKDEQFEIKLPAFFKPFITFKGDIYETDVVFFEVLGKFHEGDDDYGKRSYSRTGWEYNFYYEKSLLYHRITVYGDDYTPYRFTITRDGVTREILDSVFIKSYETFSDTIFYYFPEE